MNLDSGSLFTVALAIAVRMSDVDTGSTYKNKCTQFIAYAAIVGVMVGVWLDISFVWCLNRLGRFG